MNSIGSVLIVVWSQTGGASWPPLRWRPYYGIPTFSQDWSAVYDGIWSGILPDSQRSRL